VATATKQPAEGYTFTLELSQQEAEYLYAVLGDGDYRSLGQYIFEALANAGVTATGQSRAQYREAYKHFHSE
jgi:hypothetical protein